jgi:acetylornithine deacetylase/succinyl-diaminopimelate desuccinylase-like protein
MRTWMSCLRWQQDWSVPAFEGTLHDGMVWGRGAVDMKDMDAMILTVVQQWQLHGVRPRRDIVLLFLPDEEAGGKHGAHWVVDNRPEVLQGVSEGIGEVGGFSFELANHKRIYMIETAQKGLAWLRLRASGTAGHGSLIARRQRRDPTGPHGDAHRRAPFPRATDTKRREFLSGGL